MTTTTQTLVLDALVAGIEKAGLTAAIDAQYGNCGAIRAYRGLDPVRTIRYDFQRSNFTFRFINDETTAPAAIPDAYVYLEGANATRTLTPEQAVAKAIAFLTSTP